MAIEHKPVRPPTISRKLPMIVVRRDLFLIWPLLLACHGLCLVRSRYTNSSIAIKHLSAPLSKGLLADHLLAKNLRIGTKIRMDAEGEKLKMMER